LEQRPQRGEFENEKGLIKDKKTFFSKAFDQILQTKQKIDIKLVNGHIWQQNVYLSLFYKENIGLSQNELKDF
jgi:hypothetical protein